MTLPHFTGFNGEEDTRAILIAGEIPGYGKVAYAFAYDDLKYPKAIVNIADAEARVKFAQDHSGSLHPTEFRLNDAPEGVVHPSEIHMLDSGDCFTVTAGGIVTRIDSEDNSYATLVDSAMNRGMLDVIACNPF